MAEIPAEARDVEILASGGMFTRGYTLTFYLDPDRVNAWLASSPGVDGAEVITEKGLTTYHVEPGEGAVHAEVTIEDGTGKVTVYAHWS